MSYSEASRNFSISNNQQPPPVNPEIKTSRFEIIGLAPAGTQLPPRIDRKQTIVIWN